MDYDKIYHEAIDEIDPDDAEFLEKMDRERKAYERAVNDAIDRARGK